MELRLVGLAALAVYLTVVCVGGSFLLIRFRRCADDLKIRARSPDLATFPAVYAIVVGGLLIPLQEVLQLCGMGYPCALTLTQSWLFIPVWGAPFALRSLRVLIATDKARQERLGFFLRKRTTLAMEAFLCTVAVLILVTLSQVLTPYSRGPPVTGARGGACYMMMEWRFLLPVCVLQMVIFGVLGFKLRDVDDLLNISSELRVNFMLYLLFCCPYFVLTLHYRYRTDMDVPTSLQLLISAMVVLAMINTMWASIGGLEDLFERIGWECQWGFNSVGDEDASTFGPSSHGTGSAASVIHGPPVVTTRSDVKRWKQHYSNVPSIMRNANMAAAFGALANRFLCSESFNFLVALAEYRAFTGMGTGPGPQYLLFIDVCKEFVMVNSEQEINISHDQRQQILRYMSYRKFSPLRESERADIFRDAEGEVGQMLQLNLLATFHSSAAFAETCAAVDVEHVEWDLEEEKCLVDINDGIDGGAGLSGVEMAGRDGCGGAGGRRESGDEPDSSWLTSGSDTASWRGSGSALLSHLALSSSISPSR